MCDNAPKNQQKEPIPLILTSTIKDNLSMIETSLSVLRTRLTPQFILGGIK